LASFSPSKSVRTSWRCPLLALNTASRPLPPFACTPGRPWLGCIQGRDDPAFTPTLCRGRRWLRGRIPCRLGSNLGGPVRVGGSTWPQYCNQRHARWIGVRLSVGSGAGNPVAARQLCVCSDWVAASNGYAEAVPLIDRDWLARHKVLPPVITTADPSECNAAANLVDSASVVCVWD
jgi:hypothetical protein